MAKQTAGNNADLARIKKAMNAPTYKATLAIYNAEGREAARAHLGGMFNDEARERCLRGLFGEEVPAVEVVAEPAAEEPTPVVLPADIPPISGGSPEAPVMDAPALLPEIATISEELLAREPMPASEPTGDPAPPVGGPAAEGGNLAPSLFDVTKHDGRVTIHNPATGGHRTFKISTARSGSLAGKRIVSLLTGPDNGDFGDWTAFATVTSFRVNVWFRFLGTDRRADGRRVASEWERFAGMLEEVEKWEGRGLEYVIEARCRRCSRILTHPSSLISGLGPECYRRES